MYDLSLSFIAWRGRRGLRRRGDGGGFEYRCGSGTCVMASAMHEGTSWRWGKLLISTAEDYTHLKGLLLKRFIGMACWRGTCEWRMQHAAENAWLVRIFNSRCFHQGSFLLLDFWLFIVLCMSHGVCCPEQGFKTHRRGCGNLGWNEVGDIKFLALRHGKFHCEELRVARNNWKEMTVWYASHSFHFVTNIDTVRSWA